MKLATVAAFVLSLTLSSVSNAEFLVPGNNAPVFEDWTRGDANSTYAEWDSFTSGYLGPNSPDASDAAGETTPAGHWFTQNGSPSGFIVSSGNLYVPAPGAEFEAIAPGYDLGDGYNTRVVLQVLTLGLPLDSNSLMLTPSDAPSVAPSYSSATVISAGMFGVTQHLFAWDVAGNASGYTITFSPESSNLSLDRVAIDTYAKVGAFTSFPVPEPGVALLAAIAAVGAGWRRV